MKVYLLMFRDLVVFTLCALSLVAALMAVASYIGGS
jgi:hypothetical protein